MKKELKPAASIVYLSLNRPAEVLMKKELKPIHIEQQHIPLCPAEVLMKKELKRSLFAQIVETYVRPKS